MPESHDVVRDAARIARSLADEARRGGEPDHATYYQRVAGDADRRAGRLRELSRRPGSFSTADRHPDTAWQRRVGGTLRELGADLDNALAATDRRDWPAVLEAVRQLQGRAVVTRAALERRLGPSPVAADLPPLVRAVRAVGRLITEGEIESLPPDELRVRMHAVLAALHDELRASLQASDLHCI